MATDPDVKLPGERRSRIAIVITSACLMLGGAFITIQVLKILFTYSHNVPFVNITILGFYQAWKALQVEQVQLPNAALSRIAALATQNNGINDLLSNNLCSSNTDLSLVTFALANGGAVNPQLAQHVKALAPDYLPLQAQDAIIYFDPEDTPVLKKCTNMGTNKIDCPDLGLSSRESSSLGWHLYSQLPSSSGDQIIILALTSPPIGFRKIYFNAPSQEYSNTSYQLSDRVLLVLMDMRNEDEDEGMSSKMSTSVESTTSGGAAREIVDWLLGGLKTQKTAADSVEEITNFCLQQSAVAIARFLKIVSTHVEIGGGITAGVAGAAHAAVDAFEHAEKLQYSGSMHKEALAWSRIAWRKGTELVAHPDLAVNPQFPSEHVLALLLPIGLPIVLAVLQGIGREVRAARKKKDGKSKPE